MKATPNTKAPAAGGGGAVASVGSPTKSATSGGVAVDIKNAANTSDNDMDDVQMKTMDSNNENAGGGGPGSPSSGSSSAAGGGGGNNGWFSKSRREPLLFVPGCLLVILFVGLSLGYSAKVFREEDIRIQKQGVIPQVASLIVQLSLEMQESTTFVNVVNYSLTDRQQAAPLLARQQDSLHLLQTIQSLFVSRYGDGGSLMEDAASGMGVKSSTTSTTTNKSPFFFLPFSSLRNMQYSVLRRSVNAKQIVQYYDELRLNAVGLLSTLAANEVYPGSRDIYAAVRSAEMMARNSILKAAAAQAETSASSTIDLFSLQLVARSKRDDDFYSLEVQPLFEGDATRKQLGVNATSQTTTRDAMLQSFQQSGTWNPQVVVTTGSVSVTRLLDDTAAALTRIQSRFLNPNLWNNASDPRRNNRNAIIFASVVIGILVLVLTTILVRAVQAVVQEAQDALETNQMMSLDASYQRMLNFIDSIANLKLSGVKTLEGKTVQTVERDVYSLEGPTRQLLSFLHPCTALLRTTLSALSTSSSAAAAAAASSSAAAAAGGGDGSAAGGGDKEIIPRRLQSTTVSLVLVDLEGWQNRVTSETAKLLPREFVLFAQRVTAITEQYHGVVHDISCSKMTLAWNLVGESHESETLACQTVLALHKTLSTELPQFPLRFAVVTGECSVGVTGTDTLKSFTCVGPCVPLAALLLKLNRVHGTACVVDDMTFAKLDGQTFRTRPLEVVAVDAAAKRCVAFEMLVVTSAADKDGRSASWNEAFDEYKSGNFQRAKYLFRKWQTSFGDTKSLQRLVQLLSEDPPRQCTYRFNDDGLVEDELM